MKALDILCSKTTIPNTLKQKPVSFENTVNILFRTVSTDLGHSWLNTPQKETTKSQLTSKQIPKISYPKQRHTKTVNPETKFQHKIQIGNILYPEFGNELLNTWNESPPKIRKGFGNLKQFQQAPILHVWGLSFELRRRMEIRNKLFQKISLHKTT